MMDEFFSVCHSNPSYNVLQEAGCDTSCIEYLAKLKSVSSLNVPAQTKLTSSSEYNVIIYTKLQKRKLTKLQASHKKLTF